MKLTTTLNLIRKHSPCEESWKKGLKLLDKTKSYNEALTFDWILENLGLDDALWCLRAVTETDVDQSDKLARLFACDCADRAMAIWFKHYPKDNRPQQAISVARRFANGEASREELDTARNAAWDAARAAAWAAAAWDAEAAAARAAAWAAEAAAAWAAEAAEAAAAWAAKAAEAAAEAAAKADAKAAEEQEQTKLFRKYFC